MKNWLTDNLLKIKEALFKTRSVLDTDQAAIEKIYVDLNEDYYESMLEKLIKSDIGFDLSNKIVSKLKNEIKSENIEKAELNVKIKEIVRTLLGQSVNNLLNKITLIPEQLNIFLVVGVNGSGKTTSIGKLAKKFKDDGHKVLIAAADTFRAAAENQLLIWSEKAQVDIYSPEGIKKPDAVVYGAIEKAKNEKYDLLIVDTAGRLHSQVNLMEELKKINTIIDKNAATSKKENLIVLDASIGQNAITQAELFQKAIGLSGIVLAKLDSSSKGGVVLNIISKLSLPVKFIGTGEQIDDIAEFTFDEYLEGLLN